VGSAAVLDACLPGGTGFMVAWLILSVAIGLVTGSRLISDLDEDPAAYRRRWGKPPRTAVIAITCCLALALAALVIELAWPETVCGDRMGRKLIWIVPWAVAGLAVSLPPIWKVARRDRAASR
jgi:hypothetical protein